MQQTKPNPSTPGSPLAMHNVCVPLLMLLALLCSGWEGSVWLCLLPLVYKFSVSHVCSRDIAMTEETVCCDTRSSVKISRCEKRWLNTEEIIVC